MKIGGILLPASLALVAIVASAEPARAQDYSARVIPSRVLPVPDTVSPQLREMLAQHSGPQAPSEPIAQLQKKFGVSIARRTIGGVSCYALVPGAVAPLRRDRLILLVHGGGFTGGGGEAGLSQPILLAGLTGYRIIAVDYRLLPEHPFPAAMDDFMAVWKEIARSERPGDVGLYGNSVGGNMVLALVQRAKREGRPLPGAVIASSPVSDLSKTGDTYYAHAGVDDTLGSYEQGVAPWAKLYANGRDLKNPLLSPVYGDFSGFPPTFLISGTRDLLLSNTVRVQRKLLQAGAVAQLEVLEAMPHGQGHAAMTGAPEFRELYSQVGRFLDERLGATGAARPAGRE